MIAIIALMSLSGIGNFWFTYGIWPRSWVAFTIFFFISLVLSLMLQQVYKDKED